jgi:hypothetical protein
MVRKALVAMKQHLPYTIGVVLIVLNVLVDNNVIVLSGGLTNVINALLAAGGLGVLHHRQGSSTS